MHLPESLPLPSAPPTCAALDGPRMEALAQLAAGIAPALGDLLTVIRGQAGSLLIAPQVDRAAAEPLNQIYTAAEKAGSLIRQLLIFSRRQPMHPETVNLNRLINDTSGVLQRLLGNEISLELRLAPELPLLPADRDMLEQVLLILALNAREAMPTGGRVTLTTSSGEVPDRPTEKLVVLRVSDTGSGIAPEILPRIFEPFFTTKAGARNAGLGLATAFGIVQQHRGQIAVESAVNQGTTFTLSLPAAPAEVLAATSTGLTAAPDSSPRAGRETILLVEDDVPVREFTVAFLQEQGFRVLQAGTGADALEAWKWHGARVRLLLTDMVLDDGMNGLELAAKLRADRPDLKVICTSGHTRETMKRFPAAGGECTFLQKPCRPQALLAAVRTALDSARS